MNWFDRQERYWEHSLAVLRRELRHMKEEARADCPVPPNVARLLRRLEQWDTRPEHVADEFGVNEGEPID